MFLGLLENIWMEMLFPSVRLVYHLLIANDVIHVRMPFEENIKCSVVGEVFAQITPIIFVAHAQVASVVDSSDRVARIVVF